MRTQITGKPASRISAIAFACLALLIAPTNTLSAQQPSASTPSAPPDYRFEVASIRPVGPPTGQEHPDGHFPPSYTPGHYREEKMSLASLAMEAFKVKHSFEIEYPHWMASTWFTVNATLPEGADKADLPIMIQHLLEDRFGLVFHHETHQMAGYELVVVKSGLGLTKSVEPAADKSTATGPQIEIKNGEPQFGKNARSGELWIGANVQWRGRNETMEHVAWRLAAQLGMPVKDATGLGGEYDFTLLYTAEPTSATGVILSPLPPPSPTPAAGGADASAPLEHPLLREALQEQLGLKLQPVKNVPLDIVVIDSANKQPTEN